MQQHGCAKRLSYKSNRERQRSYAVTHMWNLKQNTNKGMCETNRLTDRRWTSGYQGEEGHIGSLGWTDVHYCETDK